MRSNLLVAFAVLSLVVAAPSVSRAQAADSTQAGTQTTPTTPPSSNSSFKDKIYYGGSVTLSFGNATRIGVYPMIAYKVRPKLSFGVEAGYEYLNYDNSGRSAHNYGGSVFGRYRLVPQLYAHAEYQLVNYEFFDVFGASSRETVPFLLLGGGYTQKVGPRTWAYGEVLVDVLRDDQSPYDDWEPVISFGIGVGF